MGDSAGSLPPAHGHGGGSGISGSLPRPCSDELCLHCRLCYFKPGKCKREPEWEAVVSPGGAFPSLPASGLQSLLAGCALTPGRGSGIVQGSQAVGRLFFVKSLLAFTQGVKNPPE